MANTDPGLQVYREQQALMYQQQRQNPQQPYVAQPVNQQPQIGQPVYNVQGQYVPVQPPPTQPYYQNQAPQTYMAEPMFPRPQVLSQPMGRPTLLMCPYCRTSVQTAYEHELGCAALCSCILCCLLFWPCIIVPLCWDECHEHKHYCPRCTKLIGYEKRMFTGPRA